MKRACAAVSLVVALVVFSISAAEVLNGSISDKMCGADHKGQDPVKCTLECVKHGSPFVFVGPGNRVLEIENQKDAKIAAQLESYAGRKVTVAGTVIKGAKAVRIESMKGR